MKICLITKKTKPYVKDLISFLKLNKLEADIYDCDVESELPKHLLNEKYDIIISYISSWIIPESLLMKTKKYNINFHPGPPEYPGTGCFNFALYNNEKTYGVTAHIMNQKVDSGQIIGVQRFKITDKDTVASLAEKSYENLFLLFKQLFNPIFINDEILFVNDKWKRKPYTRQELEKLSKIDLTMSIEEISNRIRCSYYPGKPGPYIDLKGLKFEYNPDR